MAINLPSPEQLLAQAPQTADQDEITKQLIAQQKARATATVPILNAGLDQAGQTFGGEQHGYDTALGMNPLHSAIQMRNDNLTKDFTHGLMQQNELEAPYTESKNLARYGGNIGVGGQFQAKNYALQKQNEMDKQRLALYRQQQQDSVLAGILGILGTIGGVALGALTGGVAAGPLAAAGGQLGNIAKGGNK